MKRVYALFLASGAAALVYQVVWSRLLQHVFGVTAQAVAVVLATFLCGLALGGLILGRAVDRRRDALRFYGLLEIGIGLAALGGMLASPLVDAIHARAVDRLGVGSLGLLVVRVALASAVILPPTFLMGGTLPAVTRVVVRGLAPLGRELAALYALNTLGAVVGSLAAGFWLIGRFGLQHTLELAALTNLLIGACSLWLAARGEPEAARFEPSADADARAAPREGGAGILFVMALSGSVTLGLEVLWTRTLVLGLGTATYAFATMLTSFLLGLTAGSFAAKPLVDRARDLRRTFGWLELGIAVSVLATIPVTRSLIAGRWLAGSGAVWLAQAAARFGVSLLVMLVPTMLIGATFPIAAKIWTRDEQRLGSQLGQLWASNVAGNVVGAIVAGFVLLPAFGLQRGVIVLAALSLVCAAWGFVPAPPRGVRAWSRAAIAIAGIAAAIAFLLAWHPAPFPDSEERPRDVRLYYRESPEATVTVLQRADRPDDLWMSVDGIRIGQSLGGVDAKQQVLAHFPFLLASEPPRDVLTIGLGTGIVVGQMALYPSVREIVAVELSPAVIEAAELFAPFHAGAIHDPRVRIVADDGMSYVRRARAGWDAIVSDAKSRMQHAGNSTFLSRDFYTACRDRLSPGGIFIQWLPLDVPPHELEVVLRTFFDVFEHGWIWVSLPHSTFFVGSNRPLAIDVSRLDRLLEDAPAERLRAYGWTDARGLLSMLVAGRESTASWLAGGGEINTLDHPRLEFYSPRSYAEPPARRRRDNLAALLAATEEGFPYGVVITNADANELARNHAAARDVARAWTILLAPAEEDESRRALDLLNRALDAAPGNDVLETAALSAYARVARRLPGSPEAQRRLGRLLGAHHADGTLADEAP